ncbi:MAG: hypothetical protein QM655_09040 [Nocardioidaceae bacterium]
MSQEAFVTGGSSAEDDQPRPVEGTGHAVVDAVLGRLDSVEDISVDERLPIFEQAHEALRDLLDGTADRATDSAAPSPS